MTLRQLGYILLLLFLAAARLDAQVVRFPSAQPPGAGNIWRQVDYQQDPSTLQAQPEVGDSYFDLDRHLDGQVVHEEAWGPEVFTWQVLPSGLIYRPYLAGQKEPGFATQIIDIKGQGATFEGKLGTQVGLIRYGDRDPIRPEGFQIDAEGSAQVRMNIPNDVDVYSVDFRAGLPITFGNRRHQTKLGYYHLSSHVGDEFLEDNPGFQRLNYARDVLMFGQSFYWTEKLRLYGEIDWAFYSDVADPWEVQFGVDYAPCGATGFWGAPFFALNVHLREEVDYSGIFVVQAGWAWRGDHNSHLLRIGFHYLNGKSPQYSFHDDFERQIGFGVWYQP